jgi:hypothetical protein
MDVHAPNTETFTAEFNPVLEQGRLERLTGDPSICVALIVGTDAVVARHDGVDVVPNFAADMALNGCYVIGYRRGKVLAADGQRGEWFQTPPRVVSKYHPDQIAEVMRRHKESA